MQVFVPILFLISMTKAELPVGDGYPSSQSSHHNDQHHSFNDFQRSLTQEYSAPGNQGRSISQEYGTPNQRSASSYETPSDSYSPPEAVRQGYSAKSGLSQEYGTPSTRQLSKEYGTPNARSNQLQKYASPSIVSARTFGELPQNYDAPSARSGISQEYGVPSGRTGDPSQEYGVPSERLSQEYGTPELRTSQEYDASQDFNANPLSQEYGVPSTRSGVSEQYGAPNQRNAPSDSYSAPQASISSQLRTKPSEEYGTPLQRNAHVGISQKYGAPSYMSQIRSSFSQKYGEPLSKSGYKNSKSDFARSSISNTYGSPSLRSSAAKFGALATRNSYSQSYSNPSSSYGTPGQRSLPDTYVAPAKSLSDTYGTPNSRSLSQEHSTPSKAANLKTTAIASSYAALSRTKTNPTSKYAAPSARASMLSEQYGAPEQYSTTGQGYDFARNSLDDESNQEPANYDFAYKVNDIVSGSEFGHTEERQDNRAEGAYFVVLPDGTKQIVEYEADERGFKPRISVEPVAVSRSSGYDDNAAELTASDGPY